ncbi:MAG TPA: M90 family metallopeptidase [Burkholderiaceae bacterium]|nr:M90 family metallopeptidase [Burkholderiaceae bacterium]
MRRWWQAHREWRDARAMARRAIPDALWQLTLQRLPFLAVRDAAALERLRRLASLFLDRKEFSGAGGFVVTDEIAVAVAAQACLPILELGIEAYDGFVGIVMHASAVRADRSVMDEHGIVHEWEEELAGEAMDGGPLMLSWEDVLPGGDAAASGAAPYNVVIHEFAHVLDMRDGLADGVPLLPDDVARKAWLGALQPEFDKFCERVVCGHETLLDPYAAQAVDEYFAVAAEAFFVAPAALREEQPVTYRLLAGYFRQDPASAESI